MAKKKFVMDEEAIDNEPINDAVPTVLAAELQEEATEPREEIKEEIIEEKGKPEYLYLDVSGRKEYLSVMAKAKGLSMTKYVQSLIDEDMKKNQAKTEALKKLLEEL